MRPASTKWLTHVWATARFRRAHRPDVSCPFSYGQELWGCGRIYPDYTASSPAREKLTALSMQWCSCVSCCAGSSSCSSVRFSSNYACLLSPFANLPDHHHAASLLFGQRCRDYSCYYRSHYFERNYRCTTTTEHCFSCYRQQQQQQ